MSDISGFISALEAAQSKSKFTPEVQSAAEGIDVAALKAAYEAALAMGETETLSDGAQKTALEQGFEFATKVVMMLQTAPGPFEKKDLYVNFKIAKGEVLEKPGMFDMVVRIQKLLENIQFGQGGNLPEQIEAFFCPYTPPFFLLVLLISRIFFWLKPSLC